VPFFRDRKANTCFRALPLAAIDELRDLKDCDIFF
jgi:hypothetical protein